MPKVQLGFGVYKKNALRSWDPKTTHKRYVSDNVRGIVFGQAECTNCPSCDYWNLAAQQRIKYLCFFLCIFSDSCETPHHFCCYLFYYCHWYSFFFKLIYFSLSTHHFPKCNIEYKPHRLCILNITEPDPPNSSPLGEQDHPQYTPPSWLETLFLSCLFESNVDTYTRNSRGVLREWIHRRVSLSFLFTWKENFTSYISLITPFVLV